MSKTVEQSFMCETCQQQMSMTLADMIQHLKEHHGIAELRGTKTMVSHIDGRDWYTFTYRWEFGEVVVFEQTYSKRSDDDPMRLLECDA